jgi:hypothetical protein
MLARHAGEVSAQKAVWHQLATDRAKVWSDYHKTFEVIGLDQEQNSDRPRQFNDAATGRSQHPDEPKKRDWRARRSAAERKADVSYKVRERDRDNEHPGRSRQHDRYDHD